MDFQIRNNIYKKVGFLLDDMVAFKDTLRTKSDKAGVYL